MVNCFHTEVRLNFERYKDLKCAFVLTPYALNERERKKSLALENKRFLGDFV